MTTDLEAIGRDLHHALERRLSNKRRRGHRVRLAGLCLAATGTFATVAYASGIGADLQLDPSKWSILGGGSVDDNRGAYVHAKNREDGSNSTFMVEHDAGLPAYQAFLLHQKTLAAANSTSPVPVRTEPGALCTPDAVTRAETVALGALRAGFTPGASPDADQGSSHDGGGSRLQERTLRGTRVRRRASAARLLRPPTGVDADAGRAIAGPPILRRASAADAERIAEVLDECTRHYLNRPSSRDDALGRLNQGDPAHDFRIADDSGGNTIGLGHVWAVPPQEVRGFVRVRPSANRARRRHRPALVARAARPRTRRPSRVSTRTRS